MADTVVLGAGIIGLSVAYYLSEHQQPSTIHLVEASPELFASASGSAGGFLAQDWFGPGVLSLGRLSFDQHRRLAEAHGGRDRWGYATSTSLSYAFSDSRRRPRRPVHGGRSSRGRAEDWLRTGASRAEDAAGAEDRIEDKLPGWLRREEGDEIDILAANGTTAQIDPLRLCQFLLEECVRRGVRLHHPAKVISTITDSHKEVLGVRIAETTSGRETGAETEVPCTRIIITAGAWSPQVFATLFPHSPITLPVTSLGGYSLLVRSPRWPGAQARKEEGEEAKRQGCHAIFAESSRRGFSPEVFSRAGGQIYVSGLNQRDLPLPEATAGRLHGREVSGEALAELRTVAEKLLGPENGPPDDLEVVREGLCFRPVTPYGTPIITRIDDEHLGDGVKTRPEAGGGVFLAAGHGPWGISLSLGTGMVLAEMVQGRRLSADVSSLVLW